MMFLLARVVEGGRTICTTCARTREWVAASRTSRFDAGVLTLDRKMVQTVAS
jgi:hypothetical protein